MAGHDVADTKHLFDVIRPSVREFEMADGHRIQRVHPMPRPIDEEIAAVKLATLGVEIDALTAGQARYLASRT